jgi:RNA polymerase sigma-70 factor, ECF subfamily
VQVDDRQLLLNTRRGDERAACELWNRLAPRMLGYARTILGRRAGSGRKGQSSGESWGRSWGHSWGWDEAEDVVQGVFVSVLSRPVRELRGIEDVPSWMLRLTRNAALNHLRSIRRERARRSASGTSERKAMPFPAHQSSAWPGVDERLMAALDSLPRRHREPLLLKHMAGLSFDQLALALDINRSTAASRYRVALARLRMVMGISCESQCARGSGEEHV